MTFILAPSTSTFDPLGISRRTLPTQGLLLAFGTAILALASQVSVPMVPVPVTLQTLAITMIGVLYGWRLGTLTVLAWLGEAMLGLPVLAGGSGGLAPFVGPTAGYLVAFPLIAAMAGLLAQIGWTGNRVILSFSAHLLANLTCLAIGGAWLATLLGFEKAVMLGVVPFLIGAVVKSALAAALLMAVSRRTNTL